MKITLDKLEGLAHKLSIEVPADRVREEFTKAFKDLQKEVSLKGFRKGKAPLNVIRTHYGDRVKQDVLQNLISDSYQAGLEEHSLDPIGYPKIKFENFDDDKDFIFTAEFEIRPEINLSKYEGLEVEQQKIEIKDEQVDGVLKNIQSNHAEMVPLLEDRPAQEGDMAEVAFEGFVDGQPLEGAQSERHMLELGSGQFIDGFEEGVIGMAIGAETTLNLKFPDEYHNKEIAGKPVEFKVKLNSLKKKSLPEIDDELAKKLGEFQTLNELKEQIRKDLESSEKQRVAEELKNKILRALVDANPVDVPKSLHERQKQMLIDDVQQRMKHQGLNETDFEEYKTKWDDDFNQSATFVVQSSFLVDALADKLSLRPTKDDFEKKIEEIAGQTGLEADRLKEYYLQQENQSRLSFQIMEEKVVAFLIDKAKIQEV
ncbi:MAG: trigger factor [Bdellovibrionaceae bacterium]|nr:trigger factor [Bdellovibrionales bacterium]MCB9085287.1 trigger factor [Pseudobdellovibrionaceae bacterium]